MKYKRIIVIACLLIITIFASGCQNYIQANEEVIDDNKIEVKKMEENEIKTGPVSGGQITIPLTNFNTLNPLLTDNASYFHFSKLIFEGLFEFDEDLSVIPLLAEDYRVLNKGKTIEIKLRSDVKWHDGEALTSHDVAFTLDVVKSANKEGIYGRMLETAFGAFQSYNIYNIIRINVIDDLNFEVNFDKSYANNLETLTFPIIPKHIFQGNALKEALETDKYKPIGTGPYKFQDYTNFKNIILIKNEKYWKGIPYIDKIIGKAFSDERTILNAFETGQISLATTLEFDWDKYKQNSRIKMIEYTSQEYDFLGFNFSNNLFNVEESLAIRKAINYGIDRQNIISKVYLGHAVQVDVPIHPDSYLLSDSGHIYGYSKNKAKQILDDAGFSLNQNSILETGDGRGLSLKLITNINNPQRLKTAEAIVEDLMEIGIEIIIDSSEDYIKKVNMGNFDIVLLGWTTSVIPDLSFMFHSSEIRSGSNFIRFKNKDMDDLLLKSYYNRSTDENLENYNEIQSLITNELPYISLFYKNRALLVDDKIKGGLNPTFFNLYRGLDKCYIPNNLQ